MSQHDGGHPLLEHEVASEVQHQQQLFPEVTESPKEESSEVTEEPNVGKTDAANVTVASAEETSGSGDSDESDEGSSESEEVRKCLI